jgi:hypothetical protein
MYSFLPHLLKIYFFNKLIAYYLTIGSPVIRVISEIAKTILECH